MRKSMWTFLIVLSSGYAVICLFFYLVQDMMLFQPQKLSDDYQYMFDQNFEEVMIAREKGAQINALWFKVTDPKGVILYFHGNAGSLANWGFVAEELVEYGYEVFIVDYRGYGKSRGKRTERIMHEDAMAAYNKLKETWQPRDIIIYGRSLGSGVSVQLAYKVECKMLILESPFYSLPDVADRYFPFLPSRLIMKYQFNSSKYIHQLDSKIYIFHGTEDEVIPYASGKKLFEKIPNGKGEFFSIEDGGHNNLIMFPQFHQYLSSIL